jgi:hypothetical protein
MLLTLLVLLNRMHHHIFKMLHCLSAMSRVQNIAKVCSGKALYGLYTLSAFYCSSTGSDLLAKIQEEDRPWAATPVAWHGVCISPGAVPVGMHQQHGQHGIMSLDLVPSIEAIIHICISQQQAALTNVHPVQLADQLRGSSTILQVTASMKLWNDVSETLCVLCDKIQNEYRGNASTSDDIRLRNAT